MISNFIGTIEDTRIPAIRFEIMPFTAKRREIRCVLGIFTRTKRQVQINI